MDGRQRLSSAFARCAVTSLLVAGTACGRVGFDPNLTRDAAAGPSLLQGAGTAEFGVQSLSTTLDAVPTPGNVLVLVGAGHDGTLMPPSGASSTWQFATASTEHPNVEIWFGVADGAGSTITIGSGTSTGMTLWVGEWEGLDATNPLDVAVSAPGTTSPASAGAISTSSAPSLVVFAVNSYLPNTFGSPTGGTWTELDTQGVDSMQRVWSATTATTTEVAPAVTETQHRWDAAVAAFRVRP